MSPSRVILIRHGQAESNLHGGQPHLPDPPLTPDGEKQCQALRDAILSAGIKFDITLVSPLLRTLQTSICSSIAISDQASKFEDDVSRMGRVIVLPELQETGNVPSDTPRHPQQNRAMLQNQFPGLKQVLEDDWDWSPVEIDSTDWLHNRGLFANQEDQLVARASYVRGYLEKFDGTVLLVSHGAFIRYLLGQSVSLREEDRPGYYFNNCEARSYILQGGSLVQETELHVGGQKAGEKREGYVTQ